MEKLKIHDLPSSPVSDNTGRKRIKKSQNEFKEVTTDSKTPPKKNADIRNYFHRTNTDSNLDKVKQKEAKDSKQKPSSPSEVNSEISYNE